MYWMPEQTSSAAPREEVSQKGKLPTHPGLLSNFQLRYQQAWRLWIFSTLWSVKGCTKERWGHRSVYGLHSVFWGVWHAHWEYPGEWAVLATELETQGYSGKKCVNAWWVTLALDILQTPLSAAALQGKGGQQGAHKPQLHTGKAAC